jgi:probable rRNA maturation factor
MVTVEIDEQVQEEISPQGLVRLVGDIFSLLELPKNAGLSIRISDNQTLQELNSQYLGIDAPTDVLSFPVAFEDPETGAQYYGDIIVSFQKAAAHADSGGHAVLDEIKLLIVHGVLHLLGYDHAAEEEKQEMWAAQDKLLAALNINARPAE